MTAESKAKLAMVAQMGRLAGHVARERVRPRRPTSINEVPRSVEHLTREWLTAALCSDHPGARVVDFTLGGGSDGSTSRGAVTVAMFLLEDISKTRGATFGDPSETPRSRSRSAAWSASPALPTDVHSRNWYVTGEGRMGLCDWQLMTRGRWALDVSYALTSALTVADRRAWDRELIELYTDRLADTGGPALSFDEAWLAYRQQVFHGLIFWLYTMGHGALQPAMQPDSVSRTNRERTATAVVDLDSLDALAGHR